VNRNKKAQMLKAFRAFATRIQTRYEEVEQALAEDRFEEAQRILESLAQSHARTSLSLRNFLVRGGKLEEK